MEITKRFAKQALDLKTDADLARKFGVTRWAVCQWGEDDPLPARRQWELRAKYPRKFPAPNKAAA